MIFNLYWFSQSKTVVIAAASKQNVRCRLQRVCLFRYHPCIPCRRLKWHNIALIKRNLKGTDFSWYGGSCVKHNSGLHDEVQLTSRLLFA